MSTDKVSVAAFDRTSMALIRVIQEDADIIDALKAEISKQIKSSLTVWDQLNEALVKLDVLERKVEKLLDLCVEQDSVADEMRVPREDGAIDVSKIREILGP